MSKFSSYKQNQLLFENWRKHINSAPQKSLITEQEANLGVDMGDLEDTDPTSPSYVSSDRPSEFNMDLLAKQSRKSRNFLVSLVRKFVKSDNTFNTTAFFNLFGDLDRYNATKVLFRYAKGLQQLKNDLDELGFDINLDIKKLIITDDGLIELEYATKQILKATGFITQPLKTNEVSDTVMKTLAGLSDVEKIEAEDVLDSDDEKAVTTMQEQQVDANMPPDEKTQEMFQILRSMNSDDSECFNKALEALSKFTGKQDTP
tara:strand:+ start:623 stop:1402 length:780 start_codon:yes stop_codon:yes gene_type:complete